MVLMTKTSTDHKLLGNGLHLPSYIYEILWNQLAQLYVT